MMDFRIADCAFEQDVEFALVKMAELSQALIDKKPEIVIVTPLPVGWSVANVDAIDPNTLRKRGLMWSPAVWHGVKQIIGKVFRGGYLLPDFDVNVAHYSWQVTAADIGYLGSMFDGKNISIKFEEMNPAVNDHEFLQELAKAYSVKIVWNGVLL